MARFSRPPGTAALPIAPKIATPHVMRSETGAVPQSGRPKQSGGPSSLGVLALSQAPVEKQLFIRQTLRPYDIAMKLPLHHLQKICPGNLTSRIGWFKLRIAVNYSGSPVAAHSFFATAPRPGT